MPRLTSLPSRVARLPNRIGPLDSTKPSLDRYRGQTQAFRAWYKTARWEQTRQRIFLRDNYTCQWPDCGIIITEPAQRICDHWKPHRGDERLFWDEGNLKTLCKACHDGPKAAAEARAERLP